MPLSLNSSIVVTAHLMTQKPTFDWKAAGSTFVENLFFKTPIAVKLVFKAPRGSLKVTRRALAFKACDALWVESLLTKFVMAAIYAL